MAENAVDSENRAGFADLLGELFIHIVLLGIGVIALAGSYMSAGIVVQTLATASGTGDGAATSYAMGVLAGLALLQFVAILRQFWLEFPSMLARWLENNYREMLLIALIALMSGVVLTM